ncbi:hypothetical protein BDR26DRAFT_501468 [Obelidium mucronatum]|nr:hypothetical protein BDR26DRAFT_501468 [Obelidium mucronatum]
MEYSQRSQSRPRRPSSSFSNAAGRPQSRNSNHSGDPNHFNPNHPNHPNPNHFDDSCLLMAGLLAAPRRKAAFLEQPPPQQQRRKQLLLAYPTTTADIQELYERVFLHSLPSHHRPLAPPEGCDDVGDNDASAHRGFANGLVPDIMDQRVCMAFGHITKAAVEKTPVLIIIEPGIRQEAPHFININTVDHYISEVELGLPGTFALRQGKNEFRFSATSSLEYQKWENAFYKSMDIVSSNRRSQSVQKRPIHDSQTNSANYSSYWSESNESSRNSMSTMNSTIRNNSINSTTPTTPGSVTSPVIRKSMNDLRAKVMGLKGFGIFKPQHQQQSSPTNYSKSPSQSPIPTINYQRASSYEQTNSPSTIAITSTSTSTSRSIAEDTLQAQPKGREKFP